MDILIIPTYGFILPEDSPGGRGTKARISAAQKLIREGAVARECIVDFPQGQFPKGRDYAILGAVKLGKNVADYARSLPEFGEAKVTDSSSTSGPGSMGTFADTIASLRLGYYDAMFRGEEAVHVHFVSDWSQLARLWLIWHAWKASVHGKGWQAHFHRAPNFRSWAEIARHEFLLAYPKCILRCFSWRFLGI